MGDLVFTITETVGVCIQGCDAATEFNIEASPEERAFLERLVEATASARSYPCEPSFKIGKPIPQSDPDEWDD